MGEGMNVLGQETKRYFLYLGLNFAVNLILLLLF